MAIEIPKHVTQWIEDVARSSYQRGWDDATAAMLQAQAAASQRGLEHSRLPAAPTVTRTASRTTAVAPLPMTLPENGGRESARGRVIRALRVRPGMRPVEIVQCVSQLDGDDQVSEGAILTAIKRLRKNGTIEKRGTEYYLKGARPPPGPP